MAKVGDMFLRIQEHFDGQLPEKDELRLYMEYLNDEFMVDVDIDEDLVNSVYSGLVEYV
jgi:hypothetical protein